MRHFTSTKAKALYAGIILSAATGISSAEDTKPDSFKMPENLGAPGAQTKPFTPHTPHSGMWVFEYNFMRTMMSGAL
ncbi:MAG: hypothetical protein R3240_02085, partial [Gammaproteobacteria bacterium]|nr:hypothetical protein [Gammaproteobacteria bacterium]